ncbi:MAG: hypothetical protein ICV77_10135 [Cyanobacteria bacterium Co-bin8]|nr:hypothetical protein [Cyanobacteria bacterium Co-bin8]
MLLKRLTLACEATFWIVVMAAVGVPQLPQSLALTARPTVQEQTILEALRPAPKTSVTATAPQPSNPPETLLEQLVARYETYRDSNTP